MHGRGIARWVSMMQRTPSRQLTWGCCCPLFAYHVNEHRTQGSGAQCTCSAQQAHSVCTRAAEAEGRRRRPCAVGCTSRSSLAHGVHLQWAWPSCSCCTNMCWWKQGWRLVYMWWNVATCRHRPMRLWAWWSILVSLSEAFTTWR